ncbi:MAG: hypothetical protein C5B53_13230 [Candidatus Melainabacteria bacterium]|nr:MAG: hypothetical protein C5B53_13230 [Candidatus Melainabacteria bacterium]
MAIKASIGTALKVTNIRPADKLADDIFGSVLHVTANQSMTQIRQPELQSPIEEVAILGTADSPVPVQPALSHDIEYKNGRNTMFKLAK